MDVQLLAVCGARLVSHHQIIPQFRPVGMLHQREVAPVRDRDRRLPGRIRVLILRILRINRREAQVFACPLRHHDVSHRR